jgi:hypothetical protein
MADRTEYNKNYYQKHKDDYALKRKEKKASKKDYDKDYREKNKAKLTEDKHNYYEANKEKFSKLNTEFLRKFKEENGVDYYAFKDRQIKAEIFQLLGDKCSNPNCPISPEKLDKRALHIDHTNGGGSQERKNSKLTGFRFYKKVLKAIKSGSKDYQLLCAYCNWMKRYENNEC